MTTLQIADSIAAELRLFGLIGAFQYDNYHISFMASALFVLMMCSMGIQQIITVAYLETIDQLTELLYILGIYIVACCKFHGLLTNRSKLASMLDGLNEKLMLPANWNCLYRNEFVKAMRHIRMSSRLYTYLVYVAIMATVTSTILNRKLLFYCFFPFETRYAHSLQGYWIAYAYQLIYSVYLIQSNISMDILTMAFLHCAAVKFKVMRHECEKLCTSSNCMDNLKAIKTAVVFHADTVRYVEEIERVFSFGLFVQCCLSGLSISVVLLKAILLDFFTETEQLLVVIFVLMSFVSEIFFYCHYGNEITHQSTKLHTSIYLCKWYKLNCNCLKSGKSTANHATAMKRSISIMLERTKRPNIVTAGRFIKLTYESYIMICRAGYQSFAVFRDILK